MLISEKHQGNFPLKPNAHSRGKALFTNKEYKEIAEEIKRKLNSYMLSLPLYKELAPSYSGFNLSGNSYHNSLEINIDKFEFDWGDDKYADEQDINIYPVFSIEEFDMKCFYRYRYEYYNDNKRFKFDYSPKFNKKINNKELEEQGFKTWGDLFESDIREHTLKIRKLGKIIYEKAMSLFREKENKKREVNVNVNEEIEKINILVESNFLY